MKHLRNILISLLLATTVAQARVANNVYVMPASGSPSVPTWGKVALGSNSAVTGEAAGACYASSTTSGLLFGILAPVYGGTGQNFSSSTGAVSVSSGTFSVGTLGSSNGGTGLSSPTANSVVLTNGASAYQTVAPGTSGNVLQSNGTTWGAASLASTYRPPTITRITSNTGVGNYLFTVTAASATAGATYTNNTQTFTVLTTISAGTQLLVSGTGTPLTSGTLTKASGTGDGTIAFSAETKAYVPPTSPAPLFIRIQMVGAGGGGGGGGSAPGPSGGGGFNGGNTTFSTTLTAGGGQGGSQSVSNGGGTACLGGTNSTSAGPTIIANYAGANGFRPMQASNNSITGWYTPGTPGSNSIFGGAGGSAGTSAAANSGSGAAGGDSPGNGNAGFGGCAGGYIQAQINSPLSAFYTVFIGVGGVAGGGGTGGDGVEIIEEHYQ